MKSLSCERALDSVEPMTLGTFSVAGPVETVTVTEEPFSTEEPLLGLTLMTSPSS